MNISVKKSQVFGEINAIPSKSYAHRICICDFLSNNNIKDTYDGFFSKDITATAECLKALRNSKNQLDCGESGSTLRFLLPLCSALGGEYVFTGHGRLLDRPNEQLFLVLKSHGISIIKTDKAIKISGKLKAGEFVIRGDISSQYISGLLMALATLKEDSTIILSTALSSKPYVDITIEVLKNYGINIVEKENGFFIKGNQMFDGSCQAEGDWSNMANFLVLGATCGSIKVKGLNINSVQGDKKILQALKDANADMVLKKNEILVKKSNLSGFTISVDDCPDLVPILAVLGANASGKTIIKNIERLKIKESDRIESTISMLKGFNIKAECDGKDLIVYGAQPKNAKVNSFNDHRIVMASAVLASNVKSDTEQSIIEDACAVEKSYPTFFKDFNSVGGKISEL